MSDVVSDKPQKKSGQSYKKVITWATQDDKTIKIPMEYPPNTGLILTYQKTLIKKKEREAILVSRYMEQDGFTLYSPRWQSTPAGKKCFMDIVAIPLDNISQFISALVKLSGTIQPMPIEKVIAPLKQAEYSKPPVRTEQDEIDELLGKQRL